MACTQPRLASQLYPGAKISLQLRDYFEPREGKKHYRINCGQCDGCKQIRIAHWARRCADEARLHSSNIMITIDYNDQNLPAEGHLKPQHLENFIKEYRRNAHRNSSSPGKHKRRPKFPAIQGDKVRYLACGEYGDKGQRPHYHLALFGAEVTDGYGWKYKSGNPELWRSPQLEELWGKGMATYGPFTAGAAAYIAGYTLKKRGNRKGEVDLETGEWRPSPFLRCSTNPGIGHDWLVANAESLKLGFLWTNDEDTPVRESIPRYYLRKLKQTRPNLVARLRYWQEKHIAENPSDRGEPERLRAEETIRKIAGEHRKRGDLCGKKQASSSWESLR